MLAVSFPRMIAAAALVGLLLVPLPVARAQCPTSITPANSIKPTIASGYDYQVVASGLTAPRSLQFDSAGNLLVLEQKKGLSSHVLNDSGGSCVSVSSSKYLIQDANVCAAPEDPQGFQITG